MVEVVVFEVQLVGSLVPKASEELVLELVLDNKVYPDCNQT